MEEKQIVALAERLAAARRERRLVDFLGKGVPPDEATAYRLQFAVHRALVAAGETFAGWKVGAALPAQYTPLGLSGPALAGLFRRNLLPSGAAFPAGYPHRPGIECEVAVRMAADAPAADAPYTRESIAARVAAVMPAMEVVDNRYPELAALDGPARIADDFLQAACVLGEERTDFAALDLAALNGSSVHNGKELGAGPGANVMGHPFAALAWLANRLIELGTHLRAGEIVMTGSVHPPQFLAGRGETSAGFDRLGRVQATFLAE